MSHLYKKIPCLVEREFGQCRYGSLRPPAKTIDGLQTLIARGGAEERGRSTFTRCSPSRCNFFTSFLWDLFGKKIIITKNKKSSANPGSDTLTNDMMSTSRYNKRFTFILVIACVTIIISTNVLLFLQVIELVPNNNMSNHVSTFLSLMQGPSGFLWFIRMVTSIIIIVCLVTYYYFIKNKEKTVSNKIKSHTDLYRFGKEDRINSFKEDKSE